MPKKIVQDIARQVRELGEEVIKEGVRQPVKLVEIAGQQLGILPRDWGENLRSEISERDVKKREEKRKKELAFWQQRQRELATKPGVEPKIAQEKIEEIEKQKELAKEAEKKKPVPEVGKKRKAPLGVKLRTKKSRAELGEWRQTG